MKNIEIAKKYKEFNTGDCGIPISFTKIKNNVLYDAEEKAYLDFSSGYGVTNAGWQRKEVIEVIKKQIDEIAYSPLSFPAIESVQLSELLLKIVPNRLTRCSRATGGGEANEIIIKASAAMNGKKKILSLSKSFHGGTKCNISMGEYKSFNFVKFPFLKEYIKAPAPYCFRCPMKKISGKCKFECALIVEDLIKKSGDIGIFFLEPVIGSGGVIVPPKEYFEIVQSICKRHNVLLALDEVLTGFGRLGSMFAMDVFNIRPDAVSFAKGMGGGLVPIGAALLSNDMAEALIKYEDVSATFAWTPLACAAAKKNIELIIQEDLAREAHKKGEYIKKQLKYLIEKHIPSKYGEIRGMGMMIGIELVENQKNKIPDFHLMKTLYTSLLEHGLIISTSWLADVLMLMPPLNIPYKQIDLGLNIIEKCLNASKQ